MDKNRDQVEYEHEKVKPVVVNPDCGTLMNPLTDAATGVVSPAVICQFNVGQRRREPPERLAHSRHSIMLVVSEQTLSIQIRHTLTAFACLAAVIQLPNFNFNFAAKAGAQVWQFYVGNASQ